MEEKRKRKQTHVYEPRVVSVLDVVQNGGLVEAREVGHVLDLVELGRVHLLDVVEAHDHLLARVGDLDLDLVTTLSLDAGGHETLALVRNPHQPLLGPLGLRGRVIEVVPVHGQVPQLRIGQLVRHPGWVSFASVLGILAVSPGRGLLCSTTVGGRRSSSTLRRRVFRVDCLFSLNSCSERAIASNHSWVDGRGFTVGSCKTGSKKKNNNR